MERLASIVIGAIACFLTLLVLDGPDDEWRFVTGATQAYVVAVIVGAFVNYWSPIVSRRIRTARSGRRAAAQAPIPTAVEPSAIDDTPGAKG